MTIELRPPPPPKPPHNTVIPPDHPWARYWCTEAIEACKRNGAKWKSGGGQ